MSTEKPTGIWLTVAVLANIATIIATYYGVTQYYENKAEPKNSDLFEDIRTNGEGINDLKSILVSMPDEIYQKTLGAFVPVMRAAYAAEEERKSDILPPVFDRAIGSKVKVGEPFSIKAAGKESLFSIRSIVSNGEAVASIDGKGDRIYDGEVLKSRKIDGCYFSILSIKKEPNGGWVEVKTDCSDMQQS